MHESKIDREQSFDRKSICIDLTETEIFYRKKKERNEEVGSNPMRVALDEKGIKVLLKTSFFFKKQGTLNKDGDLGLKYLQEIVDEFDDGLNLEDARKEKWEDLYAEVQAAHLSKYLGIPMVDMDIVEIEGIPFVAYQYLKDAKDAGFGENLQVETEEEKRHKQSLILALSALVKVWFQASDDGQFLIDGKGNLYLTDLGYRLVGHLENALGRRAFLSQQFIQNNEALLANQLLGVQTPEFEEALEKIRDFDEAKLRELICYDSGNPTENEKYKIKMLLENRPVLLRIFESIKQDPKQFSMGLI